MYVSHHVKMWFVQTCNGDNYTFLMAPRVDMYGTVKLYIVQQYCSCNKDTRVLPDMLLYLRTHVSVLQQFNTCIYTYIYVHALIVVAK